MSKSVEVAEGIEICPRCLLPIESESGSQCSCGFAQCEQATADCDDWSDVT